MSPLDALYHTAHDYPGGAAALALRLGKGAGTLSHELAPPRGSTAKMGLMTADSIMALTGDLRCLHALAANHGQMCVPLPVLADGADDDTAAVAAHVGAVAREFGEVMAELATTLADCTVSDNELAAVGRQWGEMLSAGNRLMQLLTTLNARGKPRHLREAA